MSVRWHTYPDAIAAAEACAHHVLGLIEETLSGQETCNLAVSGGSTPRLMFGNLATANIKWDRVHLFWVDERAVPPTDPMSNYRLADESFIEPARFPRGNVHRILAEFSPEQAAAHYVEDIRDAFRLEEGELPHFDIVQQGMGPDAHTASLFPGEPLIEDRSHIAAALYVEKMKQWRITLLPGTLLNAKHTVFLVSGADKAEAARNVFQAEYDPKKFPAQIVTHHGRRVAWFMDQAAARLVEAD